MGGRALERGNHNCSVHRTHLRVVHHRLPGWMEMGVLQRVHRYRCVDRGALGSEGESAQCLAGAQGGQACTRAERQY